MATHSSILAWKIPWTEDPGRLWSMGSQESDTTSLLTHRHLCIRRTYAASLLFRGREAACGRDGDGQAVAPAMEASMSIHVARMASRYLLLQSSSFLPHE